MWPPSGTPQSACPLLSRFQYIDRPACRGISLAGPFSPFPLHVCGSRPNLIHGSFSPPPDRSPHPKRHMDRFSRFSRQSLYFTIGCRTFPLRIALRMGDLGTHLIRGCLGPFELTCRTASRSVQPFLQGSLSWQTDRSTDRPRYSVCSTAASS